MAGFFSWRHVVCKMRLMNIHSILYQEKAYMVVLRPLRGLWFALKRVKVSLELLAEAILTQLF